MRGEAAWTALQEAMQRTEPLCLNDPRFVADQLSQPDAIECRELCTMCPLRAACEAYAQEGRPAAGFWAGRKRGTNHD
ncbi:WhiB family transcriptional regulator [Agromyces sp. NPDC058064]|uniref:WhiB family transcriptional regulator n=1 Tax=Agromyces sp. NPDC058064 TaxID=3346322 RepID=UPI0036DBDC4F